MQCCDVKIFTLRVVLLFCFFFNLLYKMNVNIKLLSKIQKGDHGSIVAIFCLLVLPSAGAAVCKPFFWHVYDEM